MDTWLGRKTLRYGSFPGMWVLSSSSPGVWVAITRISLSLPRSRHLLFMTSYPILYDGKTETCHNTSDRRYKFSGGKKAIGRKQAKLVVFSDPSVWAAIPRSSRQGGSITPGHSIGFRPNIFSHNCSTPACSSG